MADREELCRNLTEVKIKKNDRIKQNGKSKFSETISIVAFSVDRDCKTLSKYIIFLVSTIGRLTNDNGIISYEVGNIFINFFESTIYV